MLDIIGPAYTVGITNAAALLLVAVEPSAIRIGYFFFLQLKLELSVCIVRVSDACVRLEASSARKRSYVLRVTNVLLDFVLYSYSYLEFERLLCIWL